MRKLLADSMILTGFLMIFGSVALNSSFRHDGMEITWRIGAQPHDSEIATLIATCRLNKKCHTDLAKAD